ncbi:hypothetical protein IE077_001068, partial [Cardiosporidium cionae]
ETKNISPSKKSWSTSNYGNEQWNVNKGREDSPHIHTKNNGSNVNYEETMNYSSEENKFRQIGGACHMVGLAVMMGKFPKIGIPMINLGDSPQNL